MTTLITVLIAGATVIGTAFLVLGAGHLVHWLAHRPVGGPLYRAHMAHHEAIYPPEAFLSDEYIDPPAHQSSTFVFLPFVAALALGAFALLPRWAALVAAGELVAIGWLSSCLHDGFHVRGFWLERFAWFQRLRRLHVQHHEHMQTNLGIFSWTWDRLLGSFRDPDREKDTTAPPHWAPSPVPGREFLVALAVAPPGPTEAGRIELSAVLASDAEAAVSACAAGTPNVIARHVAPLEGEVLALWNELGREAFGFGQ